MSRSSDARIDALFDAMGDAPRAVAEPTPGTLHGIDGIAKDAAQVIWAPDYASYCALLEAGYLDVVLLARDGDADVYAPLRLHADRLAGVQKFVLAGGGDSFVAELARRIGRHRAWLVQWPTGCADAADTLRERGEDALREAVDGAEAYPLEGVHRPSEDEMVAYRRQPPPPVMTTGCPASDAILSLPTEGKLIIVTGVPAHGKTTWVRHAMAHTAEMHARRWAVFSPEMGEWQDFAARLMGWLANSSFRQMNDDLVAKWAEWMRPRFAFISRDSEDEAPTLDWLIETFRACVLRDGVTDALLDPWNQIAHQRGGMSETDYIDVALRKLSAFGRRHGCNVWIIAHPTKLRPAKPGEAIPVPIAYDIAGSASWFAKADLILCLYRTDGLTQLHLQKAKFERWSTSGAGDASRKVFAELKYHGATGRFESFNPVADDDSPPDHWPN